MAGIGIGSVWEVGSVEANYESPNQWAALSSDLSEELDDEDGSSDEGEESDEELAESPSSANVAHATAIEESDEELMESLIMENMAHATATPPTRTSTPPSLAPISEAVNGQVVKDRPSPAATSGPWSGERVKKVRFCKEFATTVPCVHFGEDMYCDEHHRFHETATEAEENAKKQLAASPLELMKMFGKAGMPDKATPEELERMKTARRTVERRAWNADRGAASVSKAYDINVAQALEAKVSRSFVG